MPSREIRTMVHILHSLLTKPGLPYQEIAREIDELPEYVRSRVNELALMGLIRTEHVTDGSDRDVIAPNQALKIEHNRLLRAHPRYDLHRVMEQIVEARLPELDKPPGK